MSVKALGFQAVHPPRSFVRSDIVTTMSHERLEHFDTTDREYSLVRTDDLIRFWRSKVKVTAGRGKVIHVDAGASTYIF